MSDEAFLAAFERCTLSRAEWTHRAHVRVAYLYASRHDLSTAIEKMRTGIQALNRATDTPEALDRGYHETITVAFMQLIHAAAIHTGPYASSHDFCDANPELLTKFALREHYSQNHLMTWEAKSQFVPPDLAPLPVTLDVLATASRLATALDVEDYTAARECLADGCTYVLRETIITSADSIIASYREHGDVGREHFDTIEYESSVTSIDDRHARIDYTDIVTSFGKKHTHRCIQEITIDEDGLVVHIRHVDLPGQRESLQAFIDERS